VKITEDSYAIQLGAFRSRTNAEAYRRTIEKLLGKKVEIVIEDNFYKVRVSEIKDRKTVDEYIEILKKNGVTEVWVISLKAKRQQVILRERQDTVIKTTETIMLNPAVVTMPDISIQLGAFALESNAIALRDRLATTLGRKVIIVREGGYYKVRISGIPMTDHSVLDALQRAEPSVGKLGLKDVWVLPVKQLVEEPAVRQPETPINPVEWNRHVPEVAKPGKTDSLIIENNLGLAIPSVPAKAEEKPAKPEPKVGLQVGIFYRKSEARRAQRRITSKLGLQVEIIPQWDYFRVIVKGFYTREETFKYYPELTGLGYPNIIPIEIK
jgi:cell division protein FtsN